MSDRLKELEQLAMHVDAQEPGLLLWEIQEIKTLRTEVERLTMVVEDLNRLGAGVYDAGLEAAAKIAEKMLRECKGSFSIPDAIRAEIKGPTDDEGMGYT